MSGAATPGRWRADLVRPAGGGDRRRPADVVRLLAGGVGAALLLVAATEAPTGDRRLADALSALGRDLAWAGPVGRALLGVVVAAVVLIALTTSSWRLLVSTATAAATALVVAVILQPLTEPVASRQQQLDGLGVSGRFPLLAVAVTVAILAIGSAFLTGPVRRVLAALAAAGLVLLLLGAQALPLDVAASALVGWAAAGLAGLLFGVPAGDATPDEVAAVLAGLGHPADAVTAVGHPRWGTARYRAVGAPDGDLVVDVHGREAEDARLLQRTWHGLVDKHGGTATALGRRQQAEHEALCLTLAERAGVPVPTLVAVAAAGADDDGYVVVADDGAIPLRELDAGAVDDELLGSIWAAVATAHQAGLAHDLLDGASITVRPGGGVQLTDWVSARPGADLAARDRDVAAVLLVTAAMVGAERAAAAAMSAIGAGAVERALPLCQRGVLDRRARGDVDKATAASLRSAAAGALGIDAPQLAALHRVSATDLVLIGGTLLGFWLLASELLSMGDLWSTLAGADWWWVALVVVLAQVSLVCVAVALRGAVVQPLPLGRVVALEYADQFSGLVGGTVAITATNIRFFQRQGMHAATAVTAGVTSSLAGGAVQAVIIVVSLPLLISSGRLQPGQAGGGSSSGRLLLAVILLAALISGVVALVPRFRGQVVRHVGPQLQRARGVLRDLLHRPRKLATMLGGQAASQVVLAVALGAALAAYGGSLSLLELLVINTFAALIGGLAPVPGGMGAVEAGLIAGFHRLRDRPHHRGCRHLHLPAVHRLPPTRVGLADADLAAAPRPVVTLPAWSRRPMPGGEVRACPRRARRRLARRR